ncbi:MAG: S8 family peptidase, partial [Candidatus Zixiibacteriota bacterium]
MKLQIACLLVVTFLSISISIAGEISPELKQQLDTCQSDQFVRVWIKLPQAESPQQLKLSVNEAAQTRERRYEIAYNRLKSIHESSQQNLLARLEQLRQSGKCRNINPSWLANVVEVEVTAGELETLSKRNDIERVYSVPMLVSIKPDSSDFSQPQEQAIQAAIDTNLKFIKAPQAWAAGYTGAGRVVCSFDTGVDGDHPALLNKWKGLNADSSAGWFDQKTQSSFPYPVLGDNHGTHVMGIMVGHNGADTVGVAFNAKWISAAVVDINGASYIDAFEWAANPDGDANTVADVPDVINHSWGIPQIGCQEVFYEIIDNLEALGIVNIFACGNEGPGASTIRNPANGANDSLDCFAVGNVNTNNPPSVITSSSRGPSNCTGAIKPNVCAPGQSIRSANIGTGYTMLSGTSVATPHVSGLVALLRQKNPNATVDQLKNAILTTTQFRPNPLNNNIGWGVINCQAALNALSSSNPLPNVRVYKYEHGPITAGSSVGGQIVLQNLGAAVTPLSATLINTSPAITVVDESCSFGGIGANDTLRASDSIRVTVSDTVTDGTILSMGLRITNGSTFTDTLMLFLIVEPALERSFVTHNLGLINFTVSNFGTYS